jgi:hypothetical protein
MNNNSMKQSTTGTFLYNKQEITKTNNGSNEDNYINSQK